MNDDEFILRLLKMIEKKVDMLPDTYIKKSYAEDIVQHCFARLWQNHQTDIFNNKCWTLAEVCAYYGVRSEYMRYCNWLRGKYCAGKFPKIFRRARFGRKTLLYRKILLTSSGSIYVLIRRKGAARHRISCLRYTAGSR